MKRRYGLDLYYHKRQAFIVYILIGAISAAAVVFLSIFFVRIIRSKILNIDSITSLYDNWDLHTIDGYSKVYGISSEILDSQPYNNTALAFLGYSSFMLAEAETDNTKSMEYLDKAIFNLRTAMRNSRPDSISQIHYMLGKSYFYKDKLSSTSYYADLVVKYLNLALDEGYVSDDIPLLLGLSYAALGETDKSISAFTEALLVRENDILLFNIAKQYIKNGQETVAKQYLVRVIDTSDNEELLIKAHILLAQIDISENNLMEAEQEFLALLSKNDNIADAHYGLGVIYEKNGDSVKARSEWRKCLKLQADHDGALSKMSDFK